MLKLKLQYFGHLMQRVTSLEKTLILGKIERGQKEKGAIEDEMVRWHHGINRHDFEQALRDGEGQGSLACCSPWSCKESDVTERLNNKKDESWRCKEGCSTRVAQPVIEFSSPEAAVCPTSRISDAGRGTHLGGSLMGVWADMRE